MASVGVRVQNGVPVQHSIAGYLCWARDQLPTCRGEVSPTYGSGAWPMSDWSEFKAAADMVAQGYKQGGQKFRRDLMAEAESGEPHPAFPDPTPYECQVLIEALSMEDKQFWCVQEYAEFEEFEEEEEESVPGEI